MRNRETSAFRSPSYVNQYDFLAALIAPMFAPKTIASAGRADKKPLPTGHNANLHQKCELADAHVLSLML